MLSDTPEFGPTHDICGRCGFCACPDCTDCDCLTTDEVAAIRQAQALAQAIRRAATFSN